MDQSNKVNSNMSTIQPQEPPLSYRMTGAIVWLGLVILIVPIWYSNPVNFTPEGIGVSDLPEVKVTTSTFDRSGEPSIEAFNSSQKTSGSESGVVTKNVSSEQSDSSQKTSATEVEKAPQKVSDASSSVSQEQWIIRVAAFRKKDDAEALEQRLKYDYETFIKFFPSSRYYSVRIGPYDSKDRAIKDQQKLNRILRIRSELVKTQ